MKRQKSNITLILILACGAFRGCTLNDDYKKQNTRGVLEIFDTNYRLDDGVILFQPHYMRQFYKEFPSSSYFIVDKERICILGVYPICNKSYQNKKYFLIRNIERDTVNEMFECDIIVAPFVDFTLSEEQCIRYHAHHFIKFKRKHFSPMLNDTCYVFERYSSEDSTNRTVLSITKNFDCEFIFSRTEFDDTIHITKLLSISSFYQSIYEKPITVSWLREEERIVKTDHVNLSNIKELNRKKFPF